MKIIKYRKAYIFKAFNGTNGFLVLLTVITCFKDDCTKHANANKCALPLFPHSFPLVQFLLKTKTAQEPFALLGEVAPAFLSRF